MIKKVISFLNDKKIFFLVLVFIISLFILDIYTKRLAFSKVENIIEKTSGMHTHIKINEYFNIVKVVNYGVSFGLFNKLEYGQIILSTITFLIILYVVYLICKSKNKYDIFIYSIIVSGGLGNLYDRIIFGGVFDFLDFHIEKYHWPAFNLADSLICVGVGLIVLKDLINFIKSKMNNK